MAVKRTAALVEHLRTRLVKSVQTEKGRSVYVGSSVNLGWGRIFGGQTVAQAMDAAAQSTNGRTVQSLSAYFTRPGRVDAPVVYEVAALSDGRSISTRHVTGYQNKRSIFAMTATLGDDTKDDDVGLEHQAAPRSRPEDWRPLEYPTLQERMAPHADALKLDAKLRRTYVTDDNPFEVRPTDWHPYWHAPQAGVLDPSGQTYFRLRASVDDDTALHSKLFAYLSDMNFLSTSLRPHPVAFWAPTTQVATISHSLVFHRPADLRLDIKDDFLRFDRHAPLVRQGRGYVTGQVFDRQGRLLVSATQEGVVRLRRTDSSSKNSHRRGGGAHHDDDAHHHNHNDGSSHTTTADGR